MKNHKKPIVTTLLLALLAFGSAHAQETKAPAASEETPRQQLTLQLKSEETTSKPDSSTSPSVRELPRVKELQPRPHGRSRLDPAPPPRPLIEVKRL